MLGINILRLIINNKRSAFRQSSGRVVGPAKQTDSRWYISALGALLTLIALIALSSEVISSGSPAQLFVIFGMIALAFVIEFVYRAVSGRTIKPSRYLGPNEVIVK